MRPFPKKHFLMNKKARRTSTLRHERETYKMSTGPPLNIKEDAIPYVSRYFQILCSVRTRRVLRNAVDTMVGALATRWRRARFRWKMKTTKVFC